MIISKIVVITIVTGDAFKACGKRGGDVMMRKIVRSLWLTVIPVLLLFGFTMSVSAEDAIADADFNDSVTGISTMARSA